MAAVDDAYSRLVNWLKIILPLAALALLSTLFLLARTIDPSQTIPFADMDINELAREQRVGNPNYAGVTEDGSAFTLSAKSAVPDFEISNTLHISQPQARLESPDGMNLLFSAETGAIDNDARTAELRGTVLLTTSDGYEIATDTLVANLDQLRVETENEISATGPLGSMTAGRMLVERGLDENGEASGLVMLFNGGVRLVYQPQTNAGED